MPDLSPELVDWTRLKQEGAWPAILIGNGASINVWKSFGYKQLYASAPLESDDRALFEALNNTHNFELVLDALRASRLVCTQLGHNEADVVTRYESIKRSLITAVNDVHIPWTSVPQHVLDAISAAMYEYESIYTTNYDLLLYWALVGGRHPDAFGDFFWNHDLRFDDANTEPKWSMKLVYYLHGGLHIYRTSDGGAAKRIAPDGQNLLALLGTEYHGTDLPLFVSEGSKDDKLRVVRSSDYLSFALRSFRRESGSLVVFGTLLGPSDEHLIEAVSRHEGRRLAIAIRRSDEPTIVAQKAAMAHKFPKAELSFFDAATHPLGDPTLRVEK